jgi:hypothetical protein
MKIRLSELKTTPDVVLARIFLQLTRQRISQIVAHFSKLNDTEALQKISNVKLIMKVLRRNEQLLILEKSHPSENSS